MGGSRQLPEGLDVHVGDGEGVGLGPVAPITSMAVVLVVVAL